MRSRGASVAPRWRRVLQAALPPGDLTVVVNTADDFELYGLYISPDLDTVMYTLAGYCRSGQRLGRGRGHAEHARCYRALWSGAVVPARGPGLRDTHLAYGEAADWNTALGSHDGALRALGIRNRIVPMTDDRVATLIDTPAGRLEFQDYFVGRRQSDDVLGVAFAGIERATAQPDALAAIREADAVVIAPSNPIVSVAPILALPGCARRSPRHRRRLSRSARSSAAAR